MLCLRTSISQSINLFQNPQIICMILGSAEADHPIPQEGFDWNKD